MNYYIFNDEVVSRLVVCVRDVYLEGRDLGEIDKFDVNSNACFLSTFLRRLFDEYVKDDIFKRMTSFERKNWSNSLDVILERYSDEREYQHL